MKTMARSKGSAVRRRGFSILELAIVLGVVGLIIGAIFAAAGIANQRIVLNQASDELNLIAGNAQSYFSAQNPATIATAAYGAATNARFISVFPREMLDPLPAGGALPCANAVANHPWQRVVGNCAAPQLGSVTVQVTARAGAVPPRFFVRYINLNAEVCTDMLTRNSVPGRDTNLVQIIVNGGAAIQNNNLPVSAITASTACNGAAAYNVEWVYNIGG